MVRWALARNVAHNRGSGKRSSATRIERGVVDYGGCAVDDRDELIGILQAVGRSCSIASTDAELILHAYAAWGDACVEHLLGDFAFAIWDAKRKRLFCARDQFGVKPFFYARTATSFDSFSLHPHSDS